MSAPITTAMVLAAGRGTRMRAGLHAPPKPLTMIADETLLSRMLGRLEAAGIRKIVINLHHKAEQIEAHIGARTNRAEVVFSDERDALLETGGGVRQALPLLGAEPFMVCNGDILWQEQTAQLSQLIAQFDARRMDVLLLLASRDDCTGYDGIGDYQIMPDGRLKRCNKEMAMAPMVFAGVQILTPAVFSDMPSGAFSMNLVFDHAQAANRLYGHVMQGRWMHVGTPEGKSAAQAIM